MSKTVFMRGLQNFIQEIRACQNKDQEERRVDKELSKIRAAFHDDKNLSGYDKRKYVWKLLYIYMMGYKIDFGHKQACDLIPKPKYKDKQVGYMACSILLHENDEFLRMVINGVHMDLVSRNEAFECLALSFIGSVGGTDMVDELVPGIVKLLSNGSSRPVVKKRAALCLLRMIRKAASDHPVISADSFCSVLNDLMEERNIGLLLASVTLFCGILAKFGPVGYESCQGRLIRILDRMTHIRERDIQAEYLYYAIPSPWLQSKCLRALQYFPAPESPADKQLLRTIMHVIIENPAAFAEGKAANPNKCNAIFSIIFEAVSLALHIETDQQLLSSCAVTLGRLLNNKEPNIRYLTLEMLGRMAAAPNMQAYLRQYMPLVQACLRDPDISIRRKAMDLEVDMCDSTNVQALVTELLSQHSQEFPMSRELVLKIASVSERHAPTVPWYIDTCYQLLERFGDLAPNEMWHRLVLGVRMAPDAQPHAARRIVDVLARGCMHESVACTAAYMLGEFGGQIKAEVPCSEQYRHLNRLFPGTSTTTKGVLMTAFVNIFLHDPQNRSLKFDVGSMFEGNQKFMDAEHQQRAAELMSLADDPGASAADLVLPMPKFPELEAALQLSPSFHSRSASEIAAGGSGGPATPAEAAAAAAAAATPAFAKSAPSFDLLGEEAILPSSGSGGVATSSSSAAAHAPAVAAAAPKPPPSAVDLLSDLFADAMPSAAPPAPPPAAAAAAPASTNNPFVTAFPPPAFPPPAEAAPLAYGAAPAAAVPFFPAPAAAAATNNPFASAWPPAAAAPDHAFAAPPPAAPVPRGLGDPFGELASTAPAPVHPPAAPAPNAAPAWYPAAPAVAATATAAFAAAAVPAAGWGAPPAATAPVPGWGAPVAAPTAAPGWGAPVAAPVAAAAPGWGAAATPPPALPEGDWGATSVPPPAEHPAAAFPLSNTTSWATAPGPAPVATVGLAPAAILAAAPLMPTGGSWAGPAPAQAHAPLPAAASVPATPPPYFEPAQPIGDVQRWYNSLLYKDRGVLYEDQYLQVGMQSTYSNGKGDLVLYLGNKRSDFGLDQVTVSAQPSSSVAATVDYSVPRNMAPKEQVQIVVKVTALGPVEEVPAVSVHYSLGNVVVDQVLRLPVSTHRFLVPEPEVSKQLFFEQWRQLGSPGNKAQEMVSREAPLPSDSIVTVMRQAQLGVEHCYLDPSPYNEAGAAYFVYGHPGQEQRVLVMCRVEGNPQNMTQFRVTVVSPLPPVSASIKELVVSKLTQLTTLPS